MANQTGAKPLGLIKDVKIFVHGIPYMVTFTFINNNVLDSNYSMILGRPWLRDARISHDWKTNIVTIQGSDIIRTIPITKKLGVQTKIPKVFVCYDFHFGIFDEEKNVMFATKLNLFSFGTIVILIHIEHVLQPIYIPNIVIAEQVPKHPVQIVGVLVVKLVTPLDIVKQHC
jgi:hypothetical protein